MTPRPLKVALAGGFGLAQVVLILSAYYGPSCPAWVAAFVFTLGVTVVALTGLSLVSHLSESP